MKGKEHTLVDELRRKLASTGGEGTHIGRFGYRRRHKERFSKQEEQSGRVSNRAVSAIQLDRTSGATKEGAEAVSFARCFKEFGQDRNDLSSGLISEGLDSQLESRFLLLKGRRQVGRNDELITHAKESLDFPTTKDAKGKKTKHSVTWADQEGDTLIWYCPIEAISSSDPWRLPNSSGPSKVWRSRGLSKVWRSKDSGSSQWVKRRPAVGSEGSAPPLSYKEALLRHPPHTYTPAPAHSRSRKHREQREHFPWKSRAGGERAEGRCFRCSAKDHQVRNCRDPLRCWWCLRLGHSANRCRERRSSS